MSDYVTLEQVKATLELTGYTFADDDIQMALSAASRGIDEAAGRYFNAGGTTISSRYYTADACDQLRIDDITSVSSLKVDYDSDGIFETTLTQNTDYVLTPLNAAANYEPYTRVELAYRANRKFPSWQRAVELTGVFGWPAIPEQIKEATTIVAAKLLRRAREAPFGVISAGIEAGVAMRIVRADPDVLFLVGPLSRNWVQQG